MEGVCRTVEKYKDGEGATNFKGREEGAGVWFFGGGGKRRGAVPVPVPVAPTASTAMLGEREENALETGVPN